jgi:hypothetical protein
MQAALALMALSIVLPTLPLPPADTSQLNAPALLAPLLFDHLQPLVLVVQTQPNTPPQAMAADYARRYLAPATRSRRVPRLPVWLRGLRLRHVATASHAPDLCSPRAPPYA